jgi:hypothetical protein
VADDWIKVRTDLPDDPNVIIMAASLSLECPTVVGHLVAFWGWTDKHTPDGILRNVSDAIIDMRMKLPGFAAALRKVQWLIEENGVLRLPKFERHNGMSAKARALENEAKRIRRTLAKQGDEDDAESVGHVSDKKEGKGPTREEKRREEKNKGSNSVTDAQPARRRRAAQETPIPDGWYPDLKTVSALNAMGIHNDFFLGILLKEFRLFWREKGESRNAKAWETTFKQFVKDRYDYLGQPQSGGSEHVS